MKKHKEGGFIASIMVNKLSTCKDFHLQTLRKMEHLTIQECLHPAVNINVGTQFFSSKAVTVCLKWVNPACIIEKPKWAHLITKQNTASV